MSEEHDDDHGHSNPTGWTTARLVTGAFLIVGGLICIASDYFPPRTHPGPKDGLTPGLVMIGIGAALLGIGFIK